MVSEKKLQRIIKHLEKLEEQTGRKCRKTPRYNKWDCPIGNFAPGVDSKGNKYVDIYIDDLGPTYTVYGAITWSFVYKVFTQLDSEWWEVNIEEETATEYTNRIMKWLRERDEK